MTDQATLPQTQTYTVEVRDSDGNDCTVYDVLVRATDPEHAKEQVWEWVKATWPEDEEDGGDGTFHPCAHECEHGKPLGDCARARCQDATCDGDGGILIGDPEPGDQHAVYHSLVDLR